MTHTILAWALQWHLFDVGGTVVSTVSILFLLRRHIGYWLVSPLANVLWMLQFLALAHWLSAGVGLLVGIFFSAVFAACRDTHTPLLWRGLECAAVTVFLVANWLTARKQRACWYYGCSAMLCTRSFSGRCNSTRFSPANSSSSASRSGGYTAGERRIGCPPWSRSRRADGYSPGAHCRNARSLV